MQIDLDLLFSWGAIAKEYKKNEVIFVEDVEASAAFWHMCDLIWLLLFPVLYLIF